MLSVSPATVKRDWEFARSWPLAQLRGEEQDSEEAMLALTLPAEWLPRYAAHIEACCRAA